MHNGTYLLPYRASHPTRLFAVRDWGELRLQKPKLSIEAEAEAFFRSHGMPLVHPSPKQEPLFPDSDSLSAFLLGGFCPSSWSILSTVPSLSESGKTAPARKARTATVMSDRHRALHKTSLWRAPSRALPALHGEFHGDSPSKKNCNSLIWNWKHLKAQAIAGIYSRPNFDPFNGEVREFPRGIGSQERFHVQRPLS